MDIHDFQTHSARALETTRSIIERFGPRLAGTTACLNAARALQEKLLPFCGNARLEFFQTHPDAFMGFYRINVLIYIGCMVFLHLQMPLAAALGYSFILVAGFLEFGYYREFYDPIFPKRTCANLLATLEPQNQVEQQLIVGAHHDSAYELTWLRRWQKLYGLKVIVPDIIYATGLLFSWIWVFSLLFRGSSPVFSPYLTWFLTFGILLVLPKFFIVSRHGSPGAGDNLVASAMLIELAHIFASPGKVGCSSLQHTRLVFASFDAEESGLRGSRAFAKLHIDNLQSIPTFMLNIDSIYHIDDIQFLVSDLNDTVPLSRELAEQCARIAGAAGYPQKFMRMVFGGGGTDAAELAKVGVKTTTLLAMPTGLVRDGLVYHTLNDTVDAVEPGVVEACLRITHGLVLELDSDCTPNVSTPPQ